MKKDVLERLSELILLVYEEALTFYAQIMPKSIAFVNEKIHEREDLAYS